MYLEEAINKATIIAEEQKADFFACLDRLPQDLDRWLYNPTILEEQSLNQGDILNNIPICFIEDDGDAYGGNFTVALMSTSCDMQPGRLPYVLAAPVVSLEELTQYKNKDTANQFAEQIKKNKIARYFFLPALNGLGDACIDFSQIVTISSNFMHKIKSEKPSNCVLSLSQKGYYFFLVKLMYFFARIETDPARTAA
ncbi:MAG TPA: hypothetical protein VLH56_01640 [Dissulfurispiraceae bacterium]|nr:hypothetical protein [Dissulfurispiraceae bacterium]